MDGPSFEALCPHLRPYFEGDPAAVAGWTDFGWVVLVAHEPAGAADAPEPLYPSLTDMRTAGFTASLVCREHHQELAWGHGSRPEVSTEFARRARAEPHARAEARGQRSAAGAPLAKRLRDWLLERP